MSRARAAIMVRPLHTKVLLVACAAAILPAAPVLGADWRVTGTFSQGFAGNVPFGDDSDSAVSSSQPEALVIFP